MQISVIINTRNEEINIEDCLKSVKNQVYPGSQIEIVVVDNNSSDRTKEIAKKYTEKVFNFGPERSSQKNFGVEKCHGEYFLHLDADMTLSESLIKECVSKVQADENIIALYIPEIVSGKKYFSKVRRFERSFYNGTPIDGVRFIKKDVFLKAGGFDEKLYACEDWDLDKRLKEFGKFGITKSVLYHNEAEFNLKKYLAKKSYYTKNMDEYIKKWGKGDPDIKKQFCFYYRYIGVFIENGKWRKLLRHPILSCGMYFLRFLVGVKFLMR